MQFYRIVSLILVLSVFTQNIAMASSSEGTENAPVETGVEAPEKVLYRIALFGNEADRIGLSGEINEAIAEYKARQDKVNAYKAVVAGTSVGLVVGSIGTAAYVINNASMEWYNSLSPRKKDLAQDSIIFFSLVSGFAVADVSFWTIEKFIPKTLDHDKIVEVIKIAHPRLNITCKVTYGSMAKSVKDMVLQSVILTPELFANEQVLYEEKAITEAEYNHLSAGSNSPAYVFSPQELCY